MHYIESVFHTCWFVQYATARQSADKGFHSTETAIAIVHNAIMLITDTSQITALITGSQCHVRHCILLDMPSLRFGVTDRVSSGSRPTLLAELKSTGLD